MIPPKVDIIKFRQQPTIIFFDIGESDDYFSDLTFDL